MSSFLCRTYVGCDLCFDWFHPECLGMSDEDILAMLSSKTFFCPSCSKFRGIDTMENTEDEHKTAVSSGSENDFFHALNIFLFFKDGQLTHTTE